MVGVHQQKVIRYFCIIILSFIFILNKEIIYIYIYYIFYNCIYLALNGSCSIHEWIGQFRSETVNFKMTSVCGHVMTLDFIGKYNNWDKVDPVCF